MANHLLYALIFFAAFICSMPLFHIAEAQDNALIIQDLRFGEHPGKNRMVLELNRPSDFRAFILTSPDRLVIDMPAFEWKPEKIQNTENSFVSTIRQGLLEPGISRIVLDLNKKAEIYSAYILAAASDQPDRLVIDYGDVKSAANINKRFGSLSTATVEDKDVNTLKAPTQKTTAVTPRSAPPSQKPVQMRKPLIVIDAGHGGVDPGAIGAGNIREKDITLGIAHRLRDTLLATGRYNVLLTRSDDRFIKLYGRVAIARENRGDLFISIHADSIGRPNVRGTSIYTLSNQASDAQTAKLAARENKADLIAGVDLNVEDKEVADILLDLVRRDTMNQSKFLANTLVDSFHARGLKTLESPHRYAGFAVLKAPDIPSILIETGFVSNPQEARLLSQKDHQVKLAETIRDGLDRYYEKLANK